MITEETIEFLKQVRTDLKNKTSLKKIQILLMEIWEAGYAQAMKDGQKRVDAMTDKLLSEALGVNQISDTGDTVDGIGIQPASSEPDGGTGLHATNADSQEGGKQVIQLAPGETVGFQHESDLRNVVIEPLRETNEERT